MRKRPTRLSAKEAKVAIAAPYATMYLCVCVRARRRGGEGGWREQGVERGSEQDSCRDRETGRRGGARERRKRKENEKSSGSAVGGEGRREEVVEGNNWRRRRRQRKRNRGGGGGVAYPTLHT